MGLKAGVLHGALFVSLFLCGLLVVFLLLPGCGNGDQVEPPQESGESTAQKGDIPLNTLVQGVYSEYGRFDEMPIPEDAPPECMVITDNEEYQRLLSLSSFQEPLEEVDFDRDMVIAAMQGPKNTGGYAISIMHASQSGTEVTVELDVVEPEPGSLTVQVLTSPYHLVKAERASFDPRGAVVFTFVDQNDALIDQQGGEI
jgi:hypothetical protein